MMMGYDMGKCFHNRKHPVIAPWIRMVALTAAWVVLWANLGMVTSMGAQAGAGNLVEARAGSQADAWAGTQADTGQRPGFYPGRSRNGWRRPLAAAGRRPEWMCRQ